MQKILLFLFLPFLATSQNVKNQVIDSKIEKVTVFLNGAAVTRTAKTMLTIGRTELVFQGISPQLDKQSIQLKTEGKFTVLSVVHQLSNVGEKSRQEEITKQETQKTDLEEKIKTERNNLLVYKREEELLLKNQSVGGTSVGMKVAELKEAADFQRIRMQEVLNKQLEIDRTIKKIEKEIQKVNQQLTTLTISQDKTTSEIVVTISAKEMVLDAQFTLSYYVQNAGWTPTYDIRVENITQPLNLAYKANVYQYSGEDWKNIKLSLSTANPKKRGVAPELQTWLLPIKNDYSAYYNSVDVADNQTITQVSGQVKYAQNIGLPGASIQLKGTKFGTTTDVNGFYKLNIPPDFEQKEKILIVNSVGFLSEEKRIITESINFSLVEDAKALDEVVVVGYGTQYKRATTGSATRMADDEMLMKRAAGMNPSKQKLSLEIEEKDAPTNQSFDILVPYNVPSDGKVYTVEIKEEAIPAVYEYYCVPKIDVDVFLNAKIINWENYKLLNGEANLFFEGTFLGKSSLNLSNKDTLQLWLGRDKNIVVSRNKLKDFRKKQFIGSNKTDSRSFEIVVKNTKKQAINMVLEDQFPISKLKEITIEDTEAPEAEVNAETGKTTWRFSLEPAKDKKVNLKYTIKSPKSGVVEVD